ncbi:MAG: 3'(2'),5'-bisphosphate nucleotidase CysQ [Rikenellaceae bacterium]|nr:3'(2'),5'-bisphosphate nucleotidase CysQ [Rikenellaceae bacterium]
MENSYLKTAIRAAHDAGMEIISVYNAPLEEKEIVYKEDKSPLTTADRRAHDKICSILENTGIPILSEEGGDTDYSSRREWNTMWIVDPLDGTKEFIKRNGEFTVNIALVANGIPVIGVVFVPVGNILYYSSEESGAFRTVINNISDIDRIGEISVKLPESTGRTGFRIVASRSHMDVRTQEYIKDKENEHGGIEIVSCGSSLKICRVAEGSADEYPRFGPTMEWDTAAGHAIAIHAGKKFLNIDTGEPLRYNKESLLNPFFIVK